MIRSTGCSTGARWVATISVRPAMTRLSYQAGFQHRTMEDEQERLRIGEERASVRLPLTTDEFAARSDLHRKSARMSRREVGDAGQAHHQVEARRIRRPARMSGFASTSSTSPASVPCIECFAQVRRRILARRSHEQDRALVRPADLAISRSRVLFPGPSARRWRRVAQLNRARKTIGCSALIRIGKADVFQAQRAARRRPHGAAVVARGFRVEFCVRGQRFQHRAALHHA